MYIFIILTAIFMICLSFIFYIHYQHLLKNNTKITYIFEQSPVGILETNKDHIIINYNPIITMIFDLSQSPFQFMNIPIQQAATNVKTFIYDSDTFVRRIDQLVQMKRTVFADQVTFLNNKTLEQDYIPLFSNGKYIGAYWFFRDITPRKEQEKQLQLMIENLQFLSYYDPLTKLGNRRLLFENLDELYFSKNHNTSCAIYIIDLDYFKKYNDLYGHLQGDDCLVQLSNYLMSNTTNNIRAYRYGGEEFILLYNTCTYEEYISFGNTIVTSIASLQIPHEQSDLKIVTVSVGGIFLDSSFTIPITTSIKLADEALYTAKKQGKNQFVSV